MEKTKVILERITFNPEIMGGRACIRGMRITVTLVLKLLASDMTIEEILREYPDLELEDIQASLKYASLLADEKIYYYEEEKVA
ncbi:MAG: DUF433 domain-containing protein [Cyanobacterium sp. T60_A2020_053]|nr:DUF433 domain-containing protein [Cyanobacterium sp. T60_A2020_053]